MNLDSKTIIQSAELAYNKSLNDPFEPIEESAETYLNDKNYNKENAIDALIKSQSVKIFSASFIANIGGIITRSVSLPSELASLFYPQIKMILTIAYIKGYDIYSNQVKILAIASLTGDNVFDIFNSVGLQIGKKGLVKKISSLPDKTLLAVNEKVSFYLFNKIHKNILINLGKAIPIFSGLVAGICDSVNTLQIGKASKYVFV